MKIYISFDFEGINGVSRFSQVEKKDLELYNVSLKQAYKEINTVIEAAFSAGAEKITVNDAHSSMINLDINFLDERVSLISGKPKAISMMAGLNNTYQAVILLGYHARAGAAGANMAHTFVDSIISVRLNGIEAGEAYLNSLYAATLDVPVAMVTGDEALEEEVYNQIGGVPFVKSKQAIGVNAVKCKPNIEFLKELEETTTRTLNNPTNWILNKVNSPYELEVEFNKAIMADLVELIPGLDRLNSRKIRFTHPCFETVYKLLQVICIVISTSDNYY